MKTPIFGPFYVSRSSNLADNRLINLYPEVVETKQGKAVGGLYFCPGLDLLATVGMGPIRGTHRMGALLFVVSGGQLYHVDRNFVAVALGAIADGPVTMVDNGTQVFVAAGINCYVWSAAGGFAAVVLPFVPTGSPITCSY